MRARETSQPLNAVIESTQQNAMHVSVTEMLRKNIMSSLKGRYNDTVSQADTHVLQKKKETHTHVSSHGSKGDLLRAENEGQTSRGQEETRQDLRRGARGE